jgi:DNA invertase Pin-like site-specific DNA recombinase
MTMTYLPYLRVSTDKQAEEGLGLASQEKAIRALLRQRRVTPSRFFEDHGVSGAVEDRPALSELLQSLGPGDVVVVARLDRLARDLLTQEVLLRDVRQHGADVVSCSNAENDYLKDDPQDPTRKLIRQVLGAVSEFERALIKLRLHRGRALKAERGGFAYGSPPFGYRADGGELVPVPEEQAAIQLAVELFRSGASLREIGVALAERGYPSKRGGSWYPSTMARLLDRSVSTRDSLAGQGRSGMVEGRT